MQRIGLVLGAGGETGGAFHAGVLAGLAEATGWDPRTADLMVGTSAGSLTAAILRAGVSAADLAARSAGTPLTAEGAALAARAGESGGQTAPPARVDRGRMAGPAAPGMLLAAARRPWTVRPAALVAGLLPGGATSTAVISEGIGALYEDRWPHEAIWICAVRLEDGRLVVFGKSGVPRVRMGDAVAASCAIPGYFTPVEIGGARYIDGGAHSLTNLAQVAGAGLDLVVVIAPMSRAGRYRTVGRNFIREAARTQLELEARRVRRRGAHVIAFQPTPADQLAMGFDAMDPNRRAAVVRQARISTLRRLERADVRRRLAPLTGA